MADETIEQVADSTTGAAGTVEKPTQEVQDAKSARVDPDYLSEADLGRKVRLTNSQGEGAGREVTVRDLLGDHRKALSRTQELYNENTGLKSQVAEIMARFNQTQQPVTNPAPIDFMPPDGQAEDDPLLKHVMGLDSKLNKFIEGQAKLAEEGARVRHAELVNRATEEMDRIVNVEIEGNVTLKNYPTSASLIFTEAQLVMLDPLTTDAERNSFQRNPQSLVRTAALRAAQRVEEYNKQIKAMTIEQIRTGVQDGQRAGVQGAGGHAPLPTPSKLPPPNTPEEHEDILATVRAMMNRRASEEFARGG